MAKRITFRGPVTHMVETEYPCPRRSRAYGVRKRASTPVNVEERPKQHHAASKAIAKAAHSNACRLYQHESAESTLLILGKLRKYDPKIWTCTGMEASTEDAVCKLCDEIERPPSKDALHAYSIDQLATRLGVELDL